MEEHKPADAPETNGQAPEMGGQAPEMNGNGPEMGGQAPEMDDEKPAEGGLLNDLLNDGIITQEEYDAITEAVDGTAK